jgi:hypothetical protein
VERVGAIGFGVGGIVVNFEEDAVVAPWREVLQLF